MPRTCHTLLGALALAGVWSVSANAHAGPPREGPPPPTAAAPAGPPPAIEVRPLYKTRHNMYAGFGLLVGVTNYDSYRHTELATGLGLNFRMGGRIIEALALGAQLYEVVSFPLWHGAVAGLLVEASAFPIKKLGYRGLALHFGLGGISYTRRIEADDPNCIASPCLLTDVPITSAGLAGMIAVGWDFWARDRFNFGLHLRYDAGFVPDKRDPRVLLYPSLQLAFNWY